jgi:hypothetical protein
MCSNPNFDEMEEDENKSPEHQSLFGSYFPLQYEIDNIFNDTYEKTYERNIDLGAFF